MPSGWQSGWRVWGTQEMVLVATNAFSPLSSPSYLPRPPSYVSAPGHLWLGASLNQLRPDPQNLLFFFSNIVLHCFPDHPGLFLPLSLLVVPKLVAREVHPEILTQQDLGRARQGEGSCALPKYRGSTSCRGRSQCSAGNHPSSSDLQSLSNSIWPLRTAARCHPEPWTAFPLTLSLWVGGGSDVHCSLFVSKRHHTAF